MSNQIETELNNDNKKNQMVPHFMLVPMFMPGHMIPMVDMAHLIAERGALVSIITTPVNAARIKPTIDRVNQIGLPIRFVELNFNHEEAGVPEGCESFDLLMPQYQAPFLKGLIVLQKPLESYLETIESRPTCIISDNFQWWTMNIAEKLSIPLLIFSPFSCFFNICSHNIREYKIYKDVCDEYQPVEVPNLPHKISVTKATSPLFDRPGFQDLDKNLIKAEEFSDGIVFNTFKGLELEYLELYGKTLGKRVWPIGPFSLYNKDASKKALRGQKTDIDEISILNWLDSKESKSVIYVTFGTQAQSSSSQIVEIGCGLEASNKPFVWVIKESERTPEVVNWMSSGFEERTKERGLIITGWAPQLLILSHPAVGGIMTHCGWNSIIEAICAGMSMITCPHLGDQFLNEKLVVDIQKIGVSFGIKEPKYRVDKDKVRVGRDEVKQAVINLMEGGEGEEMRKRAQKLGEMAHMAIEEGGSSFESLSSLIQFAMEPFSGNGSNLMREFYIVADPFATLYVPTVFRVGEDFSGLEKGLRFGGI